MKEVRITNSDGETMDRYFEFAVLSNSECGNPVMPSIFTNLIYYMGWILDNLK